MARRGEAGANACRWNGRLCLIGAEDCTGSTSSAAQILDRALEPNGRDSGWCACQRWYSLRRSNVFECWRYAGSTTALSLASLGSWTRRSHASRVTKANSRFLEVMCSLAKLSKRVTASLNVPALRTCSQVRVVRLAKVVVSDCAGIGAGNSRSGRRTAEGRDRSVDRLDQNALAVKLQVVSYGIGCVFMSYVPRHN